MKSYAPTSFSFDRTFKLSYSVKYVPKLIIVSSLHFFHFLLKVLVGKDVFTKQSKCPNDLDVHANGFLTVQDARKHGYTLLREGKHAWGVF